MPVYDFQCKSCGHSFSTKLKVSERKDPEKEPCNKCESGEVVQKIGSPLISYSQPGVLKTTDNFNDRLKEMKKRVGKENTLSDSIR